MTVVADPASYRDPSGQVFRYEGRVYRRVNEVYASDYEALHGSGLYAQLVSEGLLVPHQEVALPASVQAGAYRILEPEQLPFISYPYEWSFGQLRDAALATLAIQRRAIDRGMTLKDGTAFNIQFLRGRPTWIDSLSFEAWEEGTPWVAYNQFCRHFLTPLLLQGLVDVRLASLGKSYLDGIPLDLASRLLPASSWLWPPTLLHVHLHARSIRRHQHGVAPPKEAGRVSRAGMLGIIDSLKGAIERLTVSAGGGEWAAYESFAPYSETSRCSKEALVRGFLTELRPGVVWDLGANTGAFSRIAAAAGAFVVALDADALAVDRSYRTAVADGETRILPLVVDLTNPTASLGWGLAERASLFERANADLVLALALVHHLAIGHQIPFDAIARLLARLARNAIVEFVPPEDPQVQRLIGARTGTFVHYTRAGFEEALARAFVIRRVERIDDSDRLLYVLERQG